MATYMLKHWTDEALQRIPNNTISLGEPPDGVKDIIRGTTPEHFISLPFNLNKDVRNIRIIYKQGTINKLIKTNIDINIDNRYPNRAYYQLTEEETFKFKAIPNEPVLVQVRAELMNWDVVSSEIKAIKVLESLDETLLSCEMYGVVDLVKGSDAEHFISIPYPISELAELQVKYYQLYGASIIKTLEDMTVAKDNHTVHYIVSGEESLGFKETDGNLYKCNVAVKVKFKNGLVCNSNEHTIEILNEDIKKMFK